MQSIASVLGLLDLIFRNLAVKFLNGLVGLEDQLVRFIHQINFFFLLLVGFSVFFSVLAHPFDFFIRQTRVGLDRNVLLLVRTLVFGRNVNDPVLVDVEGNLDLRNATWCRWNVRQLEVAKRLVVGSHWTFTLQNMEINGWLVVSGRREDLALGSWDRRVTVDQLRHYPTHGFNTKGKWRHVKQNNVLNVTSQNPTLNGSPQRNGFIRVDRVVWFLASQVLNQFLNGWNPR